MSTLQEAITAGLAKTGAPSRQLNDAQMQAIVDAVTDWLKIPGEDAISVWDNAVAPGGMVCSICGMPVESEPCEDHMPREWERMTAELDPAPEEPEPWYPPPVPADTHSPEAVSRRKRLGRGA